MTEKTWDTEDPRELPYRFVYSLTTDEVFVLSLGGYGVRASDIFENHYAFHRYLVEGLKLDDAIADKVIHQSQEILKRKQNENDL